MQLLHLCGYPKIFRTLMFNRLMQIGNGIVDKEAFTQFYTHYVQNHNTIEGQCFALLAKANCNYIVPDDFKPVLEGMFCDDNNRCG